MTSEAAYEAAWTAAGLVADLEDATEWPPGLIGIRDLWQDPDWDQPLVFCEHVRDAPPQPLWGFVTSARHVMCADCFRALQEDLYAGHAGECELCRGSGASPLKISAGFVLLYVQACRGCTHPHDERTAP